MKKIIYCILISLFFIFPFKVYAKEVDVILFVGQSNLRGSGIVYQNNATPLPSGYNNIDFSNLYGNIYEFRNSELLKQYTSTNNISVNKYEYIGEYNNECGLDSSHKYFNYCHRTQTGPYSLAIKFVEKYVELTGHNVVMVPIASSGRGITYIRPNFELKDDDGSIIMPTSNNYYVYIKNKYNAAITYLNNNGYTINNKFYVMYNGELENTFDEDEATAESIYKKRLLSFHNTLKKDTLVEYGALVNPGHYYAANDFPNTLALGQPYRVGTWQKELIEEKEDLILASSKAIELSKPEVVLNYYIDRVHFMLHGIHAIAVDSATNVVTQKKLLKNYLVKYNCNGGQGTMSDSKHYYNESKSLSANQCVKSGYTFKGWAKNKTSSTIDYENQAKIKNLVNNDNGSVTLYALWNVNSYTLSYDSVTETKIVTYDSTYGDLPLPSKIGYVFKGWYLDNTYTKQVTNDTKVQTSSNHKLYAKWQANSYTLSYDSSTSTKTITYDSGYGDLPTPSKTGYTFKGWYLDNTYTKQVTSATKVTTANNHKLYAKWQANSYTLSYDSSTSTKTITYDSGYGDLPTPSKTGYTFKGWYLDNTYTKQVTSATKVTTANNHKLYAKWQANSYTLSYDAVTTTKTITYDSGYGDLPTPSKTGYTFKGWYLDNTYTKQVTSATKVTIANNHKLYAKWQANSYTLSYDSSTLTKTITYDSVYGELSTPTKPGYAFKGWYLENTYKTLITKTSKVTRNYNHMLYGKWELIKPDITKTSDYKVKDGVVSNVKQKTEIKDLNLGLENHYKVMVKDKNKKDKTTGKVATNDKVQIYLDNTLVDEYTVVIKGDVTGTGESSVSDVAKLYQHLKKKITMEDCYIEAGNVVSTDSEIKINDIAKLYQFIKGKIKTLD